MNKFFVVRSDDIRTRVIEAIDNIEIDEKHPVQVEIKDYVINRSVAQNKYFHGIIRRMANHLGYSAEEMKQIICHKFLGTLKGVDPETHAVVYYTPSTASLSYQDFDDLNTQTEFLAVELGVNIEDLQ